MGVKITIVSGPFYPTPPAPTGAVQRIWARVATELAARGHQVTILACRADGQPREEARDGVTIRRRTSLRQGRFIYWDLMKDLVYAAWAVLSLPPGDIVVTHSFWAPVLAQFRQRTRGRVVVHVATAPKGQMFLYRRVAALDTVSEAMREMILKEAPWARGRVTVSPNPIEAEVFRPPAQERRWDAPGPKEILYSGRVHASKGLHLLVEAYTRLRRQFPEKGLTLRLVGPVEVNSGGGGEAYLARLRQIAGDHPIAIDGPIYDRAQLAAAHQRAHYYCYPSLAEGGEAFGVAPLEAMATGLVPVVSDMPGFLQFLEHERTGLVFAHEGPDPVGALTAALARLIEDPELTARMSRAGIERAGDFSYAAVTEGHMRHFEDLVARTTRERT